MKKISNAPGWLDISGDRLSFVFNLDKARTVERIFRETAAGVGAYALAQRLNSEGIPTIGPSPRWIPSSISKILQNRAVLGEHQPVSKRSGRKVLEGDPISGYYPRVIEDELFFDAKRASKSNLHSNKGRKGEDFTNLFSGLLFCGTCREKMKLENTSGRRTLVCSRFLSDRTCHSDRWYYPEFEADMMSFFKSSYFSSFSAQSQMISSEFTSDAIADRYKLRANWNRLLKLAISRLSLVPATDGLGDEAFHNYALSHRPLAPHYELARRSVTLEFRPSGRFLFQW